MDEPVNNSHDKFFRTYFGRPDVARDFIHTYLPDIAPLLDVPSLQISQDSFIDKSLREHFSDLVYQVNLQRGKPTYIYLLFDHKSYVDDLVRWQLLKYMVQIWDKSLQTQQAIRQKQPRGQKTPLWFAPILPLIVYHGQEKWTVSREFVDIFGDVPAELRPYLPNFQYRLWDLSDYPPEAITGGVLLRVAALLLKYIYDDELKERLPEIFTLLRELAHKPTVLEHLQIIMRYLSGGKQPFDKTKLKAMVDELFTGDETMKKSFLEKMLEERDEAYEEGLTKGREEGLTKGREEGQRQTHISNIKQTLAIRFAVPMETYNEPLTQLTLPQLETLSREALLATDIAAFAARLQEMTIR